MRLLEIALSLDFDAVRPRGLRTTPIYWSRVLSLDFGGSGLQARTTLLIAALFSPILGVGGAQAHSPYFTVAEKITLPNGRPGEIRLLHGDGIFWADPIVAIAIDENRQMLGHSRASPSLALRCANGQCIVYDLDARIVLQLDPSTFRAGPLAPAIDNEDRELNWALYEGGEWGWRAREASLFELLTGNIALASRIRSSLGWTTIAGLVAGPALRRAFRARDSDPRSDPFVWIARLLFRLLMGLIAIVATVASLYLAIALDGATLELWIAAFAAGAFASQIIPISTGRRTQN